MSFHFKCPYCATELEAQDEWVGLQTTCPGCRKSIEVKPAAASVPVRPRVKLVAGAPKAIPRNVPPAAGSFPFVCPACGSVTELDSSLLNQVYECPECCEKSIAVPAEERPCPHCGQMIKYQAKICRFCKKPTEVKPGGNRSAKKAPVTDSTSGMALRILVYLLTCAALLFILVVVLVAVIKAIFF